MLDPIPLTPEQIAALAQSGCEMERTGRHASLSGDQMEHNFYRGASYGLGQAVRLLAGDTAWEEVFKAVIVLQVKAAREGRS